MMLKTPISTYSSSLTMPDAEIRSAGTVLANSIRDTLPRWGRRRRPRKGLALRVLSRALQSKVKTRTPLLENTRLIHAAEKQSSELASTLHQLPAAVTNSGHEVSRVLLIAGSYLDTVQSRFSEESCVEFLAGFQAVEILRMAEVWALKPALMLEILNRLLEAPEGMWPFLVASLRQIGEADWKEIFEAASVVHCILEGDPAGCYARMDFDSREVYREAVGSLARHSSRTEQEVAMAAVGLAREWHAVCDESRASVRRSHVGHYLLEGGLPQLRSRIKYRPPARASLANLAVRYPTAFYLIGVELLTFAAVVGILTGRGHLIPVFAGMVLLILPASQTAVEFMNRLVTFLVRPRRLPRLDFSKGVPDDCATMVAVPTLLLNEAQVRDLVLDLEIRFLANSGPNVYFALLTDSPDSDRRVDERDRLVDFCRQLIEALNRRYPGSPFFHFHRHRTYNDSEARWMGWERKRGKLLDLNRLLRGAFDAFPTKTGDLSVLERIRYVLTLDSDTQLPRDAAARLIGTIAHPLNAAVVDPVQQVVVEGYGILQPRIGISIRSASSSRLAALYSGETGFDIYTRAISDVYQDLFGEGIFTGKGIYEVDVMRTVLERRFPENALLSHDLIEGAYARVALVSDIELIDDYPSHFSAYNRRKHRWVRGDWQILRWLWPRVPNFNRDLIPNPISVISRWKIFDNLRRSLIEPALVILLLGGLALASGLTRVLDRGRCFPLIDPGLYEFPVLSSSRGVGTVHLCGLGAGSPRTGTRARHCPIRRDLPPASGVSFH